MTTLEKTKEAPLDDAGATTAAGSIGKRYYTVVFPFSNAEGRRQVLLGLKKRGMGEGLWNGFGGKVEPQESFDECAHRELKEECGLEASHMRYVGVLYMTRKDGSAMTIYAYTAHGLSGAVEESDEMKPQWFDVADLPYNQAYSEARLWWPTMLSGEFFIARFVFSFSAPIKHQIERVDVSHLPSSSSRNLNG